jgi:hypothetical protein
MEYINEIWDKIKKNKQSSWKIMGKKKGRKEIVSLMKNVK